MNILHVSWSAGFGGIERVIYDLASQQLVQGDSPAILLGVGGGEFHDRSLKRGIPVIELGMKNGFDLRSSVRKRAGEAMQAAEIIHFHAYIPAVALIARNARRPLIYTEHGNFGLGRLRRWNDRLKDWGKRGFVNRTIKAITANSEYTASQMTARYDLDPKQIRMLYNGIDLRAFQIPADRQKFRREFGLSDQHFCVGAVSRLAGVKRIDRLVRAFAVCRKSLPNARLVLIGDGPERQSLQNLIDELGLASDCILTGFRQDVPNILASLDAFVVSAQGESFGLAAVEAAAQGLPVLGFTDGGGVLEIIQTMNPELIVENEGRLAAILLKLASDPAWAAILSQRSRERAALFTIERMADAMKNIYLEVN